MPQATKHRTEFEKLYESGTEGICNANNKASTFFHNSSNPKVEGETQSVLMEISNLQKATQCKMTI